MKIYPILSLIAAIVCFFFAFLVLLKGKANKQNRSFALATVLTGIWTLFPFATSIPKDDYTALIYARLLYLIAAFVPTAWFYFMMNLLDDQRERAKLYVFYVISLFFAAVSFQPFLVKGVTRFAPSFYPQAGSFYFAFIIFFAVVFTYILSRLFIEFSKAQGYRKSQLMYVNWAYLMGAVTGVVHFVSAYIGKEILPHDLFIIIYPCILAYAIVKYRLMDVTVTITRTGIFVAVYTFVLGLPLLLAFFGRAQLTELFGENWWYGPLFLIAALATVGPFIYINLQKRAEAILLREQRQYQELIRQTAMGMTRIRSLKQLLSLIVDIIVENVSVFHSAIYLLDVKADRFVLKANRNFGETHPAVIDKNSILIKWLNKHKNILVFEEVERRAEENTDGQQEYKQLANELRALGASVLVPSFLEDKLLALIILGNKVSGKIYTTEDLDIFSVLANQAALAIENALLYENIEEQVRQRTQELMDVQKQLVHAEKLATVGTLAGGVAHEINNPLTAILTNVQMLLMDKDTLSSDAKECLSLIEEATKRCRTIVQKLMSYAKKPLEKKELSRVDLTGALKNVSSFLEYQLAQDNIKIMPTIKEGDYFAQGNQSELEQVLTNLILNARDAIKQVKKSGVISIYLFKAGEYIHIQVKDEGAGIPEEIMAKIFDPFFTTKEVGKGVGLGLSICHSIIEKHNGKISVESKLNEGTTFTIKLPNVKEAVVANK